MGLMGGRGAKDGLDGSKGRAAACTAGLEWALVIKGVPSAAALERERR